MPLTAGIIADIASRYPGLDDIRRGAELVRELISFLIDAVVAETRRRLDAQNPPAADDVRKHDGALVGLPSEAAEAEAMIKIFLKERMYRHPRVMLVMGQAESVLFDLFARYQQSPHDLPPEWMPPDGEGAERNRPRPPDRQFHRRDDRPFCVDRTPAAV